MSAEMETLAEGVGVAERDAILLEVAGWIEEGDLIAMSGILAKRKRVREDAKLVMDTSKDVRRRMAEMIRGRMTNKVGDPCEFLRDVRDGRYDRHYTGFDLRQAFQLADKGLLLVEVCTQVAGPWNNVIGGTTRYKFSLTDEGSLALQARARPTTTGESGL